MIIFASGFYQVGNAVPPPMAAAIGREIKKCVITTLKKQKQQGRKEDSLKKMDTEDVKKEESKDDGEVKKEDTKTETKMES